MDNLLFIALLIILLYYFGYYLPAPKKISNPPLTQAQSTQTEPLTNPELGELKTKLKDYQQQVKDKDLQITNLQTQIRDLAKRPLKPTNSKTTQTDDQALTKTLDTLIKDIQDLNNSL